MEEKEAERTGGRTICILALLTFFLLSALPAVCAGTVNAFAADASELVSKGIFIDDIDCSGMTREQVDQAVADKIAGLGERAVTVTVGDQTALAYLADLGLTWTNHGIIDEMLNPGTTGNIVQRYKDLKDLEHTTRTYHLEYALQEDKVREYAKSFSVYNTEPVNAEIYTSDELTPAVSGGTNGIRVDTDASADALLAAVDGWDGVSDLSVELPIEIIEPEIPYERLAIISDVLGQATTDYSASSPARAVNVENGCYKISGTLLQPGDYFSVTAAVTPFTAENGYEQAPSYEENRVVDSYGGGICQVSTTLYNAVLKAELEVTDRSNHTMVVNYVDLSKDAAIAEGSMDMAFVNTKDDPIYIVGYTYGGTITFIIYGHETRPENRSIDFESRTISEIEPTAARLYANAGQPIGYINQTQSPHTGYVAELWKNIYIDGVWQDCVQINSSYYNAVGTIYDIGVASDNPAATQAMYQAIGTGSLENVQQAIMGSFTAQTETNAQTDPNAAQQDVDIYTDSNTYTDGTQQYTYDASGDVDEVAAQ